jgi:hypothetical protein
MQIEMQDCTIRRTSSNTLQVHCPDGLMYSVSSWKEAMELIDMYENPDDDEEEEEETPAFVINDEQVEYLLEGLERLSEGFREADGKERKAAVFLFTREGLHAATVHCVANIDKDFLHELLRDWLHRETQ